MLIPQKTDVEPLNLNITSQRVRISWNSICSIFFCSRKSYL